MILTNKYKIIWSPKSYKDLQNIYDHIAYYFKEKRIANNMTKKILNSILSLEYYPERYTSIVNYKDKIKKLRKLVVNKYVVIYEVNNNTRQVFILHIFHCNQNYLNKL